MCVRYARADCRWAGNSGLVHRCQLTLATCARGIALAKVGAASPPPGLLTHTLLLGVFVRRRGLVLPEVTPTSLVHVDDEAAVGISANTRAQSGCLRPGPEGGAVCTYVLPHPALGMGGSVARMGPMVWTVWPAVFNPPVPMVVLHASAFYSRPRRPHQLCVQRPRRLEDLVQIVATLKAIVGSTPLAR